MGKYSQCCPINGHTQVFVVVVAVQMQNESANRLCQDLPYEFMSPGSLEPSVLSAGIVYPLCNL